MRFNKIKILLLFALLWCPVISGAQTAEPLVVTADKLADDKGVATDKLVWKYRAGDDAGWANPQFDDANWETIEGTNIKVDLLRRADWRGRAWLRLAVDADEQAAAKNLALVGTLKGAAEIYLDGKLLVKLGDIGTAGEINEYNPAQLPVLFKFERAGRHTLAVRFASDAFADMTSYKATWLANGGVLPGFAFKIYDGGDYKSAISDYAYGASMRVGFMFAGFLLALALLHFLLYIFYRVERANLYYSIYAAAFALQLFCGNLITFGHQGLFESVVLRLVGLTLFAALFVALLAFLHVAFKRSFGVALGLIAGLWILYIVLYAAFLNNLGRFGNLSSAAMFLSISFSIYLLVQALRQKRTGAWILFGGVQLFALGMLTVLLNQNNLVDLPEYVFFFGEVSVILAVPTAVSVFLARNFARTNRDLTLRLAEVEQLSLDKIEQARRENALRAENERRAQELEEARQLQLSMLPKKLPQIHNLEIAAYMKPATEVGGDYYDFHTGADGTLTIAVGDATGHGLKAGTVVTATKSLFNAFAGDANITNIFRRTSAALKRMNLRGLFMAMTMLKIKGDNLQISSAGMPATLLYRAETKQVEEIFIKAMPLGSAANFPYELREVSLLSGDCIVVMSDGFPEMFNPSNEMLGFDEAARILSNVAGKPPQEIVNRFVEVAEKWACARPADDDVTFVVLKAA